MAQKKPSAVRNRLRALGSKAGRDAELPVTDSFLLEMADDGALRLKGSRGIACYTPERVTLLTDKGPVTVSGSGLYLMHYSDAETVVGGAIGSIELGREAP